MALQACRECGREVSNKSKRCPNCGAPVKKKPIFAIVLFSFLLICLIGYLYGQHQGTTKAKPQKITLRGSPCKKHVEINSAKIWAKELGVNESVILASHKINIWEGQSLDWKGKVVGQIIPGSRAVILDEGPEDYKIQSPLDNSIGWVNKIQISRVLYQNVNTHEPCNP